MYSKIRHCHGPILSICEFLNAGKKEKNKDKKHKNKTGKKVKEKKEDKEEKDERAEHVQFEETPQILSPEPTMQDTGKISKKKGKVEKIKPILVNKDEATNLTNEYNSLQTVSHEESNHFDVIQPKDDLELIRSHSRENLHQISQSESIVNKSPKETPTKSKKNAKEKDSKKKDDHKDEKKEVVSSSVQQVNKENIKEIKEKPKESSRELKESKEPKEIIRETIIPVQSSNKESKKVKKKNDILAQIGGDKDGINFSLLKPLVQKAELSRTEIQFLIDQLLNKQQENPWEHAEWTESRADPVIKLKKQLAEKEKALKDEQEASVSVQNKLLELRAELNGERSRLTASVRQLEEALNAKITEAQTLHTRMQHILESHSAEKQGFSRQIEQLQSKINEDSAIIHKMQEDQGQTHGQMQQELIAQRKQLEVQFTQMRDNENALKAQLAQKHVEYQELQTVNITMSQELQATCESSTHEIEMLRQQITIMQEQIIHSEGQLQHYKETGDRLQDAHRQLEESRRAQSDMDHRIKSMLHHEQELQKKITWFQTELDAAKVAASETICLKEQLDKLQSELTKLKAEQLADSKENNSDNPDGANLTTVLKTKEEDLQQALSKLENVQLQYQKAQNDLKKFELESTETRNELKLTKSELARSQDNYKLSQNDLNKCQEELREIQQILAQTRAEFSKINSTTNSTKDTKSAEADLQIIRLQEENERLSVQLGGLKELQKQLREKNEQLSSQLTASTEHPAVEGRENGIEEKIKKNNIQLIESTNLLAQKEDQITALTTATTQKEEELDQLNIQVKSLRSEINYQHSIISRLQDDLKQQNSKYDDNVQKLKVEEQEATKALLQRIFPDIEVSEKSYDEWMKVFEEKVYTILNKLNKDVKSEDVTLELEKTNKNLQTIVNHYKQIIYDTEAMLNKLQSNIELEEKRWQTQIRQKETEISNLRVEIRDLQNKTSNNELQQKIADLESRLSEVEVLNKEADCESANDQSITEDAIETEKLQETNARLSQNLKNEISKRAALDEKIKELLVLVEVSESELYQEKQVVSQLQQELSQIKSETCGSSSSSDQSTLNGPPVTDSPLSEPMLGEKCLITALQKSRLKNTELEKCSLTEPDCSAKSQQDIDNSSLTSKLASNTCHMTDNSIKNSCNSLNGQQHKKHKKKRKGGSGKK
ncbi:PREDICTED: kinectin-like isoform X3 [Ceratosolen solmsi marchali]|uniref:Kinectin-like isoform X3 n=1 Tax=Ceratosolen solmsi marchali TaxID=326594 RepID=A0AAJ7E1G5_9HYME|nr:PREDICTED: kinectin-like isoform X3 [Ceratosolen solmsi marchali]